MITGLDFLATGDYPGRFFIAGNDAQGRPFVFYGMTSRQPVNQARFFGYLPQTKEAVVKLSAEHSGEQEEIILHPAVIIGEDVLATGNGRQVEALRDWTKDPRQDIYSALMKSLRDWSYEEDLPAYTPRISALVKRGMVCTNIISRGQPSNVSMRRFNEFTINPGQGVLLATYSGQDEDVPSGFQGDPIEFDISWKTLEEGLNEINRTLANKPNGRDYRPRLVGVYLNGTVPTVRVSDRGKVSGFN